MPAPTRPSTPDVVTTLPDGRKSTRITAKRCCNGCGRELGNASVDELNCAVAGLPLPDVRDECGCA